jgi:hypothetical protein
MPGLDGGRPCDHLPVCEPETEDMIARDLS